MGSVKPFFLQYLDHIPFLPNEGFSPSTEFPLQRMFILFVFYLFSGDGAGHVFLVCSGSIWLVAGASTHIVSLTRQIQYCIVLYSIVLYCIVLL